MRNPILTFVHISDTHIPSESMKQQIEFGNPYVQAEALVQQINALPIEPDFVLHSGDVAYSYDSDDYKTCGEIFNKIKYPIYYVAGNDDNIIALQNTLVKQGKPIIPFHYEFDVNGVQIVVVDSNGAIDPPAGLISKDQLEWLSELCVADDTRPLVIATHHNPQLGGFPWLDHFTGIQNTEAFHEAILPARKRLRGVFFGHVHQNLDIYRDGILYCSTLSSWKQFHAWRDQTETIPDLDDGPGFSVITIYQGQTLIRRHRFSP